MSMPQILQELNAARIPNLQGIKQMMQMLRGSGDPMAMFQTMVQNNPQFKQVMDIVQKHGGDPMKAFREEAQARGIDPDQIMDMMK